jgi:hypothetical protein
MQVNRRNADNAAIPAAAPGRYNETKCRTFAATGKENAPASKCRGSLTEHKAREDDVRRQIRR